jgi:outer membrane protein TolC
MSKRPRVEPDVSDSEPRDDVEDLFDLALELAQAVDQHSQGQQQEIGTPATPGPAGQSSVNRVQTAILRARAQLVGEHRAQREAQRALRVLVGRLQSELAGALAAQRAAEDMSKERRSGGKGRGL